ncbi:hypothetical protein C8R47DRAFT_504040 [Mycena vitilis]|nr:hypothetical protein C8R47DRAFT_504040 [Mycena vitilis]
MSKMNIDAAAIAKFNALPRPPRAPSGLVGNHWHFDLRFIYLDPPGHVLFLVQPESTYIHSERLPLGIPNKAETLLFFPESGAEAASEVAKALIHSFLDSFGLHKVMPNAPPPYAPWSLATDDRELANAVSKEFKRLGVKEELCSIRATKSYLKAADKAFKGYWETLTQVGLSYKDSYDLYRSIFQSMGLPAITRMAMNAPEGINFSILKPKPWGEEDMDSMNQALKYAQTWSQIELETRRLSNSEISSRLMEQIEAAMELLKSKSSEQVQKEADAGDDAAALNYAIRIQCNIGVQPNRSLYHYYLLKVIQSGTATNVQKSQAHALLIDWFMTAHEVTYARYMFAASHHANQSIILAGDACPAVLWFGHRVFEVQAKEVPPLNVQYKPLWMALEKRNQEVAKERSRAEKRREKASNRYVCAAPSCYIQASKGGGLSQCSGPCDIAVKPAYCSKPCQKADWKNHKPFCKAGAPCSIIAKELDLPASGQGQTADVLSIPIAGPDGNPMMLSSSTMPPKFMKMLQALSLGEENPEGADETLDEMMSEPRGGSQSVRIMELSDL